MQVIKEVIVVEGKHDSSTLKQYFHCDTIETNGLSLNEETISYIKELNETRGVILFLDPDSPGNRIRHRINEAVPGCKNAFVDKVNARTTKKVGVEHASFEVLKEALENLVSYTEEKSNLTYTDLYELGLTGQENSSYLRSKIGKKFHLGDGNTKTMLERINYLGITIQELQDAIKE